ncbi:MAG: leucine-rich repeat domain-containing protein, partial [Clostridia bacterium]|nr:leucine-rich repeat domain-containing protein [Clostridia bacterium]
TVYNVLSLTAIANFAFENNATITRVNIPDTVTEIGREAFKGCTNLATVKTGTRLEESGPAAFSGCTTLTEITIPASVTTLNSSAFEGCTNLETVEMLPTSLDLLGEQVFSGCSSLVNIKIPTLNSKMVLVDANKQTYENINYKVGKNMFLNCTSLETVTFGAGVTAIDANAFANCASLESISLPAGLEFVGQNAFKNSGLTTITLPETVTYVGVGAFKDCTALTSAVIGSGVAYTMGAWFSGCGALESLTVPFAGSRMDTPIAVSTHFGYIFGTTAPKEADADKFEAVTVTKGEGSDAVTYTYYIPKTLTTVTILGGTYSEWRKVDGEDVETVKDYVLTVDAFEGCTMITNITVAEDVLENAEALEGWNGTVNRPEA